MRLAILLLLSAAVGADELHLKDGRIVAGVVARDGDRYTVVDRDKKETIKAAEVERVVKGRCFMDDYAERVARVSKTDPEALYEFGSWLQQEGWESRASVVFEQVLVLDPDHRGARRQLGYKLYEGAWVSPDELKRRQGLVEFEGVWYTAHDLAEVKKEIESNAELREALARRRAVTKRLSEVMPKFATLNKKKRRAAYGELVRYADELNSPLLRKYADDALAYYDALARALCRQMTTRTDVNLTEVELERPIAAIETSLGGTTRLVPRTFGPLFPEQVPVNIQLPQIDIYQTQSTAEIPSDCR